MDGGIIEAMNDMDGGSFELTIIRNVRSNLV